MILKNHWKKQIKQKNKQQMQELDLNNIINKLKKPINPIIQNFVKIY